MKFLGKKANKTNVSGNEIKNKSDITNSNVDSGNLKIKTKNQTINIDKGASSFDEIKKIFDEIDKLDFRSNEIKKELSNCEKCKKIINSKINELINQKIYLTNEYEEELCNSIIIHDPLQEIKKIEREIKLLKLYCPIENIGCCDEHKMLFAENSRIYYKIGKLNKIIDNSKIN